MQFFQGSKSLPHPKQIAAGSVESNHPILEAADSGPVNNSASTPCVQMRSTGNNGVTLAKLNDRKGHVCEHNATFMIAKRLLLSFHELATALNGGAQF